MIKNNIRLQPWRYLSEVALGLHKLGHQVTIITDDKDDVPFVENLNHNFIQYLPSVRNFLWYPNATLKEKLNYLAPDVVIWHVGMFSFLYQRFDGLPNTKVLGIFTSPLYRPEYFLKLGISKLLKNFRYTCFHILGSLVPNWLLRYRMGRSGLFSLVVQTRTTYRQLIEMDLWQRDIRIISPGVDSKWFNFNPQSNRNLRGILGYRPEDTLIVFYGSPTALRGLLTLVEAFNLARNQISSMRLLILCRRRPNELIREKVALEHLVSSSQYHQDIQIIDGYLDQEILIDYLGQADIVSLPFELISSDAPLAPLETVAIGKPIVATRVGCIPELISKGENYIVEPSDPVSLSRSLLQVVQDTHLKETNSKQISMRTWEDMAVEWSQLIQSL